MVDCVWSRGGGGGAGGRGDESKGEGRRDEGKPRSWRVQEERWQGFGDRQRHELFINTSDGQIRGKKWRETERERERRKRGRERGSEIECRGRGGIKWQTEREREEESKWRVEGATHWSSLILTNPSHPDTTMPSVSRTVCVCVFSQRRQWQRNKETERNRHRQGVIILFIWSESSSVTNSNKCFLICAVSHSGFDSRQCHVSVWQFSLHTL